jgi:hypothetical protein
MTKKETEAAIKFLGSLRGRYIISQALAKAIDVMKKVESPYREESNIADMEFLRDNLFYLYIEVDKSKLMKK